MNSVPAIKIRQWLPEWDDVEYSSKDRRRKPEPHFYLFGLPATQLRALSGINRRSLADGEPRSEDTGVQRIHDPLRSGEIARYVRYGFPWSDLNKSQRDKGEFKDLRKPGWLPTAVVINIRDSNEVHRGERVANSDLLEIVENSGETSVRLPDGLDDGDWNPSGLHPVEVIDGQHRLWAFDPSDDGVDAEDFVLPVVAFAGLDVSWRAYLFWTINIKPKKINASLAFDMYPLLRTEKWLESAPGLPVYKETRAQELTEILWSYPHSPWHHRINMLGERGVASVSQSAWIRSLTGTFFRAAAGPRVQLGGLYGAGTEKEKAPVEWSRLQQAAFLVLAWSKFAQAIAESKSQWAKSLRDEEGPGTDLGADSAFSGSNTLINTDQGVRAFLQMTNDLTILKASDLRLADWAVSNVDDVSHDEVESAIGEASALPIGEWLGMLSSALATFDWRTSSAPGLSDDDRLRRAAFRGSGGYKELRIQLLQHLKTNSPELKAVAEVAASRAKIRLR